MYKLSYGIYLKLLRQDANAWASTTPYSRPRLLKDFDGIIVIDEEDL